ncbi:response regulator transcription factor [Vibrio tubiashii]|uniref:Response regulator transcription factor n=1 Tax=Vibrio tubiashii TaxID=29498 RepID=A0AAE5GTW6_9VIBR|nr:response regulator transcription factor [Vibrio tubiashii]
MAAKILIVEDDIVLADLIGGFLENEGFSIAKVNDGVLALNQIRDFQPDVVLLDLMLPKVNGAQICIEARGFYSGFIIVITASGKCSDEEELLNYGADDYITKPVKGKVLVARIEALFRRNKLLGNNEKKDDNILTLEESSKRAFYNNQEIVLTNSEFDILHILYNDLGRIVSREKCCRFVRGIPYDSQDRAIDMRIAGVRKAFTRYGIEAYEIKTYRNKGYALVVKK